MLVELELGSGRDFPYGEESRTVPALAIRNLLRFFREKV
jgi:hypothetical protein